tara:strand:+ start:181 stop:579 length:399 start_codon:yes stop_codon:yes gene_type:complete
MNKFTIFYLIAFCLTFAGCSGENNNLNLTSLKIMDLENKSKSSETENSEKKYNANCTKKENSLFGLSRTCKNRSSFFESISNNSISSKPISENNEAVVETTTEGDCKVQENTLFGLSRSCENSKILSKSLLQ